ncbi:uncharacterized protein LOC125665694 [Ostrea edulis]|uniref:uncharacterized protein LOC125665694 n=1 Tax=Ostrea edulis TaxID=37623 RepID=UPI0024AF0A9A|nr:uncharacterized protein LOC125665694 [Ostrea edulis]
MHYRISLLNIVPFLIAVCSVESAFKHRVEPKCPESSKECVFHLHVSYIMSMVSYNWTIDEGNPVEFKNGTFYGKLSDGMGSGAHYCEEKKITYEEMQEVITADGNYKFMYSINKQFPAPTLAVYENQKVEIQVHNDMVNEAVTFHWHGMFQNGTPWMDGVSMVTQCPILPGQMFTYEFRANPRGTHWYHAHHGAMRTSGLAGAFIVLPKKGTERKDIARIDNDVVFIIQDWDSQNSDVEHVEKQYWYMQPFIGNMRADYCGGSMRTYDGSMSPLSHPFANALVNGRTKYFSDDSSENQRAVPFEVFNVSHNTNTRLRMINSGMNGEYKISIDKHKLLLIGTDGGDLAPVWIDYIVINPGETYDVILYANSTSDNYWIRLETTEVMDFSYNPRKPNVSFAVLHYNEAGDELPESEARECTESNPCVMANCHWRPESVVKREAYVECLSVVDLRAAAPETPKEPKSDPTSHEDFQEVFLNFHFTGSDLMRRRPAVNTIHYQSPPMPLQVFPNVVNDKSIVCNNQNMEDCGHYCRCTHVVKLATKKVTQLVLMAEDGSDKGTSHPVHLHGNRFQVLKYGFPVVNKTDGLLQGPNQDIEYSHNYRTAKWHDSSWNHGNVPDMIKENPPHKDTIVVPNRGYVLLRLKTDNPGFWIMHCHLETHMNMGMAVVLQVGEPDEMPNYPQNFPKCSNFLVKSDKNPASESDDSGSSKENDEFIELPAASGTSTLSNRGSHHDDDQYAFDIAYTWFSVMIIAMVVFVFVILILTLVLINKHCGWTNIRVRRRGYDEIGKEPHVVYSK